MLTVLTLVGLAIYVFFITVPIISNVTTETHLNLTLDGQPVSVFNYVPGPNDYYQYNQSVYSNSNMIIGDHTLIISSEGATSSVLEFDYAVYTFVFYITIVVINSLITLSQHQ